MKISEAREMAPTISRPTIDRGRRTLSRVRHEKAIIGKNEYDNSCQCDKSRQLQAKSAFIDKSCQMTTYDNNFHAK